MISCDQCNHHTVLQVRNCFILPEEPLPLPLHLQLSAHHFDFKTPEILSIRMEAPLRVFCLILASFQNYLESRIRLGSVPANIMFISIHPCNRHLFFTSQYMRESYRYYNNIVEIPFSNFLKCILRSTNVKGCQLVISEQRIP